MEGRVIVSATARQYVNAALRETIIRDLFERLNIHPETKRHSHRVALGSVEIALRDGASDEELLSLSRGALLHDVGKTHYSILPLLDKPRRLTAEENFLVHNHPKIGYSMTGNVLDEKARAIIQQHHEFRPGGYPRSGTERRLNFRESARRNHAVTAIARYVAITDSFDAVYFPRSYNRRVAFTTRVEPVVAGCLANENLSPLVEHALDIFRQR